MESVQIKKISVNKISIPFRFGYSHSKAKHHRVESVICLASGKDGIIGMGEAVPRTYVTGETPDSVFNDLVKMIPGFISQSPADLPQIRGVIGNFSEKHAALFPSCAVCALELSLLDLIARASGRPVVDLFGPAQSRTLTYTPSVGITGKKRLLAILSLLRAWGINRIKVKVGDDEDMARIARIRRIMGPHAHIYADANGAWTREQAVKKIEQLAGLHVWAVEEPLKHETNGAGNGRQLDKSRVLTQQHYKSCAWIRQRSPIPLIADESLISARTADMITAYKSFDIFNIRLSKCGGFFLSADLVQKAENHGLSYGFGAMVGETSVLAAAGMTLGNLYPAHQYIQGFSHHLLLKKDICTKSARPGFKGQLRLQFRNPGWGLEPDLKYLDKITVKRKEIRL